MIIGGENFALWCCVWSLPCRVRRTRLCMRQQRRYRFSEIRRPGKKDKPALALSISRNRLEHLHLKLDREVFDQAEFADDSKYNSLLCKLHFYQTQERSPEIVRQNDDLAVRYHIEQFPTVVVLSPDGRDLGRLGYIPGGVDKFAAAVNTLLVKSRSSWP